MDRTLRWINKIAGRSRALVLLLCLVQIVMGSIGVFYALLLKAIVDSAVVSDKDAFLRYILLFVLLEVFRIIISAINRRLTEYTKSILENKFKSHLLRKILYGDFSRVSATHSGEWLNRLTNDAVLIANGIVEILPTFLGMFVKMAGALGMLLFLDTRIALIMLPAAVVLGLLTFLMRKKLKRMHKDVQEKDGQLRIFMQERIESLMIIKTFGAEEDTLTGASGKLDAHKKSRMRRNTFSVFANIGYMLTMNGMYILGICYGGYGILTGSMSYGSLMAMTQLITQLQNPIVNMTGLIPKIFTVTASAERLMEIESSSSEETGKDCPVSYSELKSIGLSNVSFTYPAPYRTCAAGPDAASSDASTAPAKGAAEAPSGKEKMPQVLKDFSLSIGKGEFLAFAGHSGCGKSTVLKLLMSLYTPDQGETYYETSAEKKALTDATRSLFAYVPQGNYLMSGTIREIVSFSDPKASGDTSRIRSALKIACADSFIEELDDKEDTLLGERGTGLSEGQMQRIAIARAIFSDRPILLLDEATSGLDEETEKALLHNLRTMTDKTVVIVTHRKAVIDACDRVIDFE
jgi:ATP-binding cassette subfamily B protein